MLKAEQVVRLLAVVVVLGSAWTAVVAKPRSPRTRGARARGAGCTDGRQAAHRQEGHGHAGQRLELRARRSAEKLGHDAIADLRLLEGVNVGSGVRREVQAEVVGIHERLDHIQDRIGSRGPATGAEPWRRASGEHSTLWPRPRPRSRVEEPTSAAGISDRNDSSNPFVRTLSRCCRPGAPTRLRRASTARCDGAR